MFIIHNIRLSAVLGFQQISEPIDNRKGVKLHPRPINRKQPPDDIISSQMTSSVLKYADESPSICKKIV